MNLSLIITFLVFDFINLYAPLQPELIRLFAIFRAARQMHGESLETLPASGGHMRVMPFSDHVVVNFEHRAVLVITVFCPEQVRELTLKQSRGFTDKLVSVLIELGEHPFVSLRREMHFKAVLVLTLLLAIRAVKLKPAEGSS